MGDRTAPGAVPVITTPDFEAMVIGAHQTTMILVREP